MAKYIELSELQKFCRKYTEVDAIGLILADRTDLLHTADVIEREKIDKAIEEIENQKKIIFECDGESDLGIAIRIIQKYLGEVE